MNHLPNSLHLFAGGVLTFACIVTGCSQRPPETPPSPPRPGMGLPALVEAAVSPPRGQERLAVLDRLQPPVRVEAQPRPNRHVPGQIDTVRTYVYPGLHFRVYDVSGSAKEIMQRITVTDSTYVTEEGVRVGMHRAQVRARMGVPDQTTDSTLVYSLSKVVPSHLRLRVQNDTLVRMTWNLYVD